MAAKRAAPAAAAPAKKLRNDALERIPTEILGLIFAHFPLRARLRSVSRVCRRWRAAVLRSVDSFAYTGRSGDNLRAILSLFPALTHLDVLARSESPVVLPATLRSLDLLIDIGQDSMNLKLGPTPPSLTQLSISLYSESPFPVQLLRAARDTLASLTLSVRVIYGLVVDGLLESHLAATHFPELTSIDLTIAEVVRPEQADNMRRFVEKHAAQLQQLRLSGRITVGNKAHSAFFESLSALSFPKLRDLDLRIVGLRSMTLTSILLRAPSIRTLKISASTDTFTNVPASLLSPLVEVRTISLSSSMEFLCALPKLEHIWLPVPFPVPLPLSAYLTFRSLLSHFEFGRMDSTEAVWSALTSDLTNLSRLSLRHPCPDPPPPLFLPRLEKLAILPSPLLSFGAILHLMSVFVRNAPRLTRLHVYLPRSSHTQQDLLDLALFLRRAAGLRVAKFKLFLAAEDICRLIPLVSNTLEHGWLRLLLRPLPDGALFEQADESDSEEGEECDRNAPLVLV